MLDREYFSHLRARAKPWWRFTFFTIIAFACVSCTDAAKPPSQATVQPPHIIEATGLPLTDAVSPQGGVTPTVPVPQPHSVLIIATPTPTPMLPISYEAESSQNTLSGGALVINCNCSGGYRVGYIGLQDNGDNGTLQFNNVRESSTGSYTMAIYYTEGDSGSRTGYISVNSGPAITFTASDTGSFWVVGTINVVVSLSAGDNTVKFSNSNTEAPDIDRIVV